MQTAPGGDGGGRRDGGGGRWGGNVGWSGGGRSGEGKHGPQPDLVEAAGGSTGAGQSTEAGAVCSLGSWTSGWPATAATAGIVIAAPTRHGSVWAVGGEGGVPAASGRQRMEAGGVVVGRGPPHSRGGAAAPTASSRAPEGRAGVPRTVAEGGRRTRRKARPAGAAPRTRPKRWVAWNDCPGGSRMEAVPAATRSTTTDSRRGSGVRSHWRPAPWH